MNYYRKDIAKRKNLENASLLDFMQDGANIEEDYVEKELFENLRREIMYLSKAKRDATIMYY